MVARAPYLEIDFVSTEGESVWSGVGTGLLAACIKSPERDTCLWTPQFHLLRIYPKEISKGVPRFKCRALFMGKVAGKHFHVS